MNIREQNAPQRKYIRKDIEQVTEKKAKIQSTLLEYGQQHILLGSLVQQQQQQSNNKQAPKQQALEQQQKQISNKEEEMHIKKLMNEMSDQKQVK